MEKYYFEGQEVLVLKENYIVDEFLAIKIFDINYNKQIACVTRFLRGKMLDRHKYDHAYVDIYSNPLIEDFIKSNDLGYFTGYSVIVDDKVYPEYKFYVNQLSYSPKEVRR